MEDAKAEQTSDYLDDEATKPVSNALLDVLGGFKPPEKGEAKQETWVTPPSSRPRGRPPKNPTKSPEEQERDRVERLRKYKKERSENYEKLIVEQFNDYILTLFVGMGVPETVLFMPGKAPKVTVVDPSYTPLANALTIKPQQAKAIAGFLVELERTNIAKSISKSAESSNAVIALKGLGAAFAGASYLFGVQKTVKTLKPLIESSKANKSLEGKKGATNAVQEGSTETL